MKDISARELKGHNILAVERFKDSTRWMIDEDLQYCTGEVCHTPKELFELLLSDYRSYVEVELTQGKRELKENDEKQVDVLCETYLNRWKEEMK